MHVCVVHQERVPPMLYGGTERVVFWLAKELARRSHKVTLLAGEGSQGPADGAVRLVDTTRPVQPQIPKDADVAHFFTPPWSDVTTPYVNTVQGNLPEGLSADRNTVFVSRDHAERHGSSSWVHNGLDAADYGPVDWAVPRSHVHFLGKAAWRVKNVRGAIDVARRAGKRLAVLGGTRLNFSMGFRFTLDPRVRFAGMVGGAEKNAYLQASEALVFPVRWHEPFGIAIIESLYFGCPVFATPYGSLPELVPEQVGVLSASAAELSRSLKNAGSFDPKACHQWVMDNFSVRVMADRYLQLYHKVMNGFHLNVEKPRLLAAGPKLLPWDDR